MKKRKRIDIKLRASSNSGLFHNSREDVQSIMKVCNRLIDEVNSLSDELEELRNQLKNR